MKGTMRSLKLFPPACKAPTIRAMTMMGMDDAIAASKHSSFEPLGYCMVALRGKHSETWQDTTSVSGMKPRYGAASSVSKRSSLACRTTALRCTHSETSQVTSWASGFDVQPRLDAAVSKGLSCESEQLTISDCNPHSETCQDSTVAANVIPRCDQAPVPEKMCRCGGGVCKVWTATTEKNAGRQFYKCPLKKEEGNCGFFQWCDSNTHTNQGLSTEPGDICTYLKPLCPCGAGVCSKLTARTVKNMGREFYKCPLRQEKGCGFFKWCDEMMVPSRATTEQCHNRGMDGHLAKDHPFDDQGLIFKASAHPMPSGLDVCFKCGQAGHWAKDCSNSLSKKASGGLSSYVEETRDFLDGGGYSSPKTHREMGAMLKPGSGPCFNCNSSGHWAKDCPNSKRNSYGERSQGFSSGKLRGSFS